MVLLLVMVDICVLVTWWLVDSRVLKNRVIEITKVCQPKDGLFQPLTQNYTLHT